MAEISVGEGGIVKVQNMGVVYVGGCRGKRGQSTYPQPFFLQTGQEINNNATRTSKMVKIREAAEIFSNNDIESKREETQQKKCRRLKLC
jgi:hypothetical protein